ncbi:MAG: carboxylesterase family protein [Gammaproteobacteria bacterium]|nr:carboxylesterase family protein [Gammaproteobacteria bacterium]MYD80869.1 carboxylesterase family protein [Gammaproteobacteria bacterium]
MKSALYGLVGATRTRLLIAGTLLSAIIAVNPSVAAEESESSDEAPGLTVETNAGKVRGQLEDESVRVFKGIPFAAPPVGDLRWSEPRPAESWNGVRDATEFGADCMQPAGGIGSSQAEKSEDCLYLNIWSVERDEPQPVMVWIHGGGFSFGSGANEGYDGTEFAKSGVVLVTINYRLGLAGFFAHPGLSEESEMGISGNQGIHDQLAALIWVQENIAAFGGDPNNVTIFGESAGSMSVCYLIATPLSKGLFQKAIGQSGGCFNKHPTLDDPLENPEQTRGELAGGGHAAGVVMAQALGATGEGIEAIEELREMDWGALVVAHQQSGVSLSWRSIYVDGYLFPDQMGNLLGADGGNPVPSLVGSNTDEGTWLYAGIPERSMEDWKTSVRENTERDAEKFIELYMEDARKSTKTASQQMISDVVFAWEMRKWAQLITQRGSDAYMYVFSHAPFFPGLGPERPMGAYHAGEIAFVFNNRSETNWNEDDHMVADLMHAYWVNFAKTGSPNGNGLPTWPVYDADLDNALEINANPETIKGWRKAKLDGWESIVEY